MDRQIEHSSAVQQSEEIDLLDLLGFYISKLPTIIAAIIIGALCSGLFTHFFIADKYTAVSRMYMVSASSDSVVNLSDIVLGESLSNDYVELMKSRPIVEGVAESLGLEYTYDQLMGMISLDVVSNTRIVKISVTSTDPNEAMDIANEMAVVSRQQLPKIMEAPAPNIAEEAVLPSRKSSPSMSRNVMLGAMLLLFAVLAVYTVIYLMDDTIKTSEDVEKIFGIMPLAVIPEGAIGGINKGKDSGKRSFLGRLQTRRKYKSKNAARIGQYVPSGSSAGRSHSAAPAYASKSAKPLQTVQPAASAHAAQPATPAYTGRPAASAKEESMGVPPVHSFISAEKPAAPVYTDQLAAAPAKEVKKEVSAPIKETAARKVSAEEATAPIKETAAKEAPEKKISADKVSVEETKKPRTVTGTKKSRTVSGTKKARTAAAARKAAGASAAGRAVSGKEKQNNRRTDLLKKAVGSLQKRREHQTETADSKRALPLPKLLRDRLPVQRTQAEKAEAVKSPATTETAAERKNLFTRLRPKNTDPQKPEALDAPVRNTVSAPVVKEVQPEKAAAEKASRAKQPVRKKKTAHRAVRKTVPVKQKRRTSAAAVAGKTEETSEKKISGLRRVIASTRRRNAKRSPLRRKRSRARSKKA